MNDELITKHCKACEGGIPPLEEPRLKELLSRYPNWKLSESGQEIIRQFKFPNYYSTMAFVNAIAWMAHRENHHPDLQVSYNHCEVRYSTHAVNGLTENDFICAAKVDAIYQ